MDTGRDVFNEKPSKDEHLAISQPSSRVLGKGAIIHTTMGDISILCYFVIIFLLILNSKLI